MHYFIGWNHLCFSPCLQGYLHTIRSKKPQHIQNRFSHIYIYQNTPYYISNKAIAMMRRKSPRSENIYLIENRFQANIISKGRRGKEFNPFP